MKARGFGWEFSDIEFYLGAFALSGYIGETKSLVILDIRQNPINVAGIMAITRTLKVNRSLHSLLFDAHNTNISTPEENEMRHICLKELTEYLRRNRSIQLQPEPDCHLTTGSENHAISPKIQKAVERVSSPPMPDDISNRKNEEEEIKEILLDPPRPPGYVSPRGSLELEDVPLDIPTVANDSPFELQSIHLTMQLQNAVQLDLATSEKVDISKNQESSNQHSEMTTEEIPDKEAPVFKTVTEEPSTLFQQEMQNPGEEVPIKSGNSDQVFEELTLPKENSNGGMAFEGLGDEPPMEFEAFLQEHSEPTSETVNRKYENSFEPSLAETDESSVYHQGDLEYRIPQAHDDSIPFSVPDDKSSLQAVALDSYQQEIIEKDIFATENSQIEKTNSSFAAENYEPHFQPEESLPRDKTSQSDEMILSEFNLESENQIWREPHSNIEMKISANPDSEIPNEISYLTPNANTFNVMTTSQEKSSSEDLLKEVMQQYRNAEMTSEMEDSFYNPVQPDDFIRREVEVSESEDSLFNSLGHSPPKSTTKGVNVATGLEEHDVEELPSDSCRNKQAYWVDVERESGSTQGTFVSEKEQPEISSLHNMEIPFTQGIATAIECDNFVEQSVELKVKSSNTSVEQDLGSEIPPGETEQHGKESVKVTNEVREENEGINGPTLCQNIANLENVADSIVVGESASFEKNEEASIALTFGGPDEKMEEYNDWPKTEVVNVKLEPGRNTPLSQDVFESNRGGSTSNFRDDFIKSLSSDQLVDELIQFRRDTTIGEEALEKMPMRTDYSLLQAMHISNEETITDKIPKSENLMNSSTNEAKNVLASDTLSSSNGGKGNLLQSSGWKTAGSGTGNEVLNEDIVDVEEQLREVHENRAHDESSSEIIVQPLSEAANSAANIVSTDQSPGVVTEALKIENNGTWSDFKETGMEDPPVPPLDSIRFSDVSREGAFPDSNLTESTPNYSNINDLTSLEKPETTTFSLSDSDDEEMEQLQSRIEEMTPTGSLLTENKGSAIEPSLCSESNLAHISRNEAYWTDFDQPGLEEYAPDSFNLQLEQPKKEQLIVHGITEEEDELDRGDSFTKLSSEFQIKEPVNWEVGESDDGNSQGDAESSSLVNQIGSQMDNLDLATTINQTNSNAHPHSALTTHEYKSELEQISQSEVPSNLLTTESDKEAPERLNGIEQGIGEPDRQESKQEAFKLLPKLEIEVQSEDLCSAREIFSAETNRDEEFGNDPVDDGSQLEKLFENNGTNQRKTCDLSDISSNVQTSCSSKEKISAKMGTETHCDLKVPLSVFNNSSKVETEVLDINKMELEAKNKLKKDTTLNDLLSNSKTEQKTPPSKLLGYRNSESESTFVCQGGMKHDDFNFQPEINDWCEEEFTNVSASGAGGRSEAAESMQNEVNLGKSTDSGDENIFQVHFEPLSALDEQANLTDTTAEVEVNNQDKFAVDPIGVDQPTEEIGPLVSSSEWLNTKRQSGDTSQSYLAFESRVDSQQRNASNWDEAEVPEKTGFADFSPSIIDHQQENDLSRDVCYQLIFSKCL
ncbi:unnamed protein product [Rodentolepis nana]|uniref:CRAL-TRIO domain-containing protein n=1 Tax=Rodentolepis nana TaxID=102285 RepID=A0A0R3TYT3_RODNA|nr:unnamed protein product [Rodentolepis nana]